MKIKYNTIDSADFPPLSYNDDTSSMRKRPHLESNSDIEKNWPHFLIVECLDEGRDLTKLSPFALSKTIHSISGGAQDIKGE